jgi:hypothetical protein
LFDPFGLWKQTKESMLESWAKSMTDAVNTDPYAEMTGRMLDTFLTAAAPLRKVMEQTMTQVLSQLSLPSRAEVVSIAERMTNIELRLDDLDVRLDAIQRSVERTASAVAALESLSASPTSAVASADARNGTSARNRAATSKRAAKAAALAAPATPRTTRSSAARSRTKTE